MVKKQENTIKKLHICHVYDKLSLSDLKSLMIKTVLFNMQNLHKNLYKYGQNMLQVHEQK